MPAMSWSSIRWYAPIDDGVVLPWGHQRVLPLKLMWLGLACNSIAFGAVWFALLIGAGAIRRSIRRHRGQCEACGYFASGLARCPECGLGPIKAS